MLKLDKMTAHSRLPHAHQWLGTPRIISSVILLLRLHLSRNTNMCLPMVRTWKWASIYTNIIAKHKQEPCIDLRFVEFRGLQVAASSLVEHGKQASSVPLMKPWHFDMFQLCMSATLGQQLFTKTRIVTSFRPG